jgi:hypothetical protein
MPKMENSIDLGLRENLQTKPESDFVNKMGAKTSGIYNRSGERGILSRTLNSWRLDVSNRIADFP